MITLQADPAVLDRVRSTIGRHDMLEPGQAVLVAFSGGPDSTALALILTELGYATVLAHVDHGLRPESAADADHCARVAERLGTQLLLRRVHVDPPTQAQARRARYAALESMADQAGARCVATGHTLDDQAETVWMRLRRGGVGLGMPLIRPGVVRPLLELRRAQTVATCRRAGLDFLQDPSNRNPRYRRVQARRALAEAGPGEVERLVRVGRAAGGLVEATQQRVDGIWSDAELAEGRVRIPRQEIRAQPAAVAGQLVRRAGAELGLELTRGAVDDLLSKVLPRTGARQALGGGCWAWCEGDTLVLGPPMWTERPAEYELAVGSRVAMPDRGLWISAEPVAADSVWDRDPNSELVDAGVVDGPLTVRTRQDGDRFRPLGGPGTRKLQDFFVDAKVPRDRRDLVPIVARGSRIVWVAGYRLDDRARLTASSTAAVRLRIGTLGTNGGGAWPV